MAAPKKGMGKGLGALLGEDFSMDTPASASTRPLAQIENCASQPRKNHLHIFGCQNCPIYTISVHNANTATGPLCRPYWNTCFAKIINIPVYCPAGYLKFFCQFRSRCLFFLQ